MQVRGDIGRKNGGGNMKTDKRSELENVLVSCTCLSLLSRAAVYIT